MSVERFAPGPTAGRQGKRQNLHQGALLPRVEEEGLPVSPFPPSCCCRFWHFPMARARRQTLYAAWEEAPVPVSAGCLLCLKSVLAQIMRSLMGRWWGKAAVGCVPFRGSTREPEPAGHCDSQVGAEAALHSWDFFFLRRNLSLPLRPFTLLEEVCSDYLGCSPLPKVNWL